MGRQGYHLILSFAEGEEDVDTAFEVVGKFTEEYLGNDYEALYVVYDNTDHIHGHVIFNNVSFRDGKSIAIRKGTGQKRTSPSRTACADHTGFHD